MTRSAPSSPFEPFLRTQGFVLLDGGLATALEARGHDLRDPLWSAKVLLEAPEEVRAVHLDYLAAGADCIATVTYQATFEGFGNRGLSEAEAEAAFRLAVRLAVEARDDFWSDPANRPGRLRPLVAASVGPYGAFLADGSEYTGRYGLDEDRLVAWHRRRLLLLADSPADLLGIETIPSLPEVRALLRLLDEAPSRWAWLSFQCRDGGHLADGAPVEDAARACEPGARVAAVGVNCVPPEQVGPLLSRLRLGTTLPLAAYPNSGERYDAARKAWLPGASEWNPASAAPAWRDAGASVLGGCCRTGPDTIRRMRRALTGGSVRPS
ncbi:MAG: homocysteine S-methyltransferase [Longimicrobiales bacterium]|nr:homocysteine S-methyltransferase [Longimicrobiales bacterium]